MFFVVVFEEIASVVDDGVSCKSDERCSSVSGHVPPIYHLSCDSRVLLNVDAHTRSCVWLIHLAVPGRMLCTQER